MKLEQSQLDYLNERGGNYDRKYRMFEKLLDKCNDIKTVIELFAGTGIETYYLRKKFDIDTHILIDQDVKCSDLLSKMHPDCNINNINTFEFNYDDSIDLFVCDSVFNNKEYRSIIDLVNRYNFNKLILTNTGVLNVRFNKNISYEDYWNSLVNRLKEDGLYVTDVIYSSDFGMMLISKNNNKDVLIKKLDNNDVSKDWRKYRDTIMNLQYER